MKESNARLHSLPTNSAGDESENVSGNCSTLGNVEINQSQAASISQSSLAEIHKSIQNFETIRDPHKSMVRLIDTMFDYLQYYADESNKYNDDPHLSLHWQRPSLEKPKSNKSWLKTAPDTPSFAGKIYTCDWSLIIKGSNELVTSYVIPSDRVISFNSEPEIYSPYLTISHVKQGANFNWQIDKDVIAHEHIDQLAKKLLERLLKSARSQQWSQSVFCLQSIGMGLALEDSELDITKNSGNTSADPEQFLIDLLKNSAQQTKSRPDEFNINPPTVQDAQMPILKQSSEFKVMAKIEQMPAEQNFETALKALPNLLDLKLQQLTKEGGEAFSKHDLKGAQDMLNLSNQLSEFKEKIYEIMTAFKIQH
jgi:hypothetical protein